MNPCHPLACLASTLPLAAALPAGKLGVEVRDAKGAPLAGVRVRVGMEGRWQETRTDDSGRAGLAGGKAGRYRLEFSREGFEPLTREITLAEGEAPPVVRVNLRPLAAAVVEVVSSAPTEIQLLIREDIIATQSEGLNPILLPDGRVLLPYDRGRGGFAEIIATRRQQAILLADRELGERFRLKLAFGYAHHDQDSFYEGDYYRARQEQGYAEAALQSFLGETMVTTGLNYRFEDLRSRGTLANGTFVDGLDNYAYRTPAFYLQAYRAFLDAKL